jgi:hypothetical protein
VGRGHEERHGEIIAMSVIKGEINWIKGGMK